MNSVSRDLQPRLLPNGKTYCAELSVTEGDQDECLGNLEDLVYQSNADKARALTTLQTGVKRLKLARDPCKWYEVGCKMKASALEDLNKPTE